MNLKKSINHCLVEKDKNKEWLAEKLDISTQAIYKIQKKNSGKLETLEKMAEIFEMPLSEFLALGEKEQA